MYDETDNIVDDAEGQDEADIVAEAQARFEAAWNHDQHNREAAQKDLRFLAGDQWPEKARRERETTQRPMLTINRLPQFVNLVANNVRKNPPAIKAIPAGGNATKDTADAYSGIFRQIQYRSNATRIFADAAYYAVGCGVGHFRICTDYVNDGFEQEIKIEHIANPLSVLWDPDASKPDRSDAEFCFVSDWISEEAFKRTYPDAPIADFNNLDENEKSRNIFWHAAEGVRVAEYWRKIAKKKRIGLLRSGETVDLTPYGKKIPANLDIVRERVANSYEIEQYLLGGNSILSGPHKWAGKYLPIFPVIGQEISQDDKVIRKSVIRDTLDAQVLYNYARTTAVETMAQAPRSPYLVTSAMIQNHKPQWDSHNTFSRPYLTYDPDPDAPGGRPTRERPSDIPSAFVQEAQIASDEMKATTGMYDAALGMRSNETSGVAINAREMQGQTSTLHFTDNLLTTLHHLGNALIDLIPKIYDTERVMTVLREDETQEEIRINVPAIDPETNQPILDAKGEQTYINDLSVGVYDIRVKIGPAYATAKAEAADSMLQFIKSVPGAAAVVGDLIAKNMSWPGADVIAERLQKMLPAGLQPEPEDDEAKIQAAQAREQAKAEEDRNKALMQAGAIAQLEKAKAEAREKTARATKAEAEAIGLMAGGGQQPSQVNVGVNAELENLKLEKARADVRKALASADHATILNITRLLDMQAKELQISGQNPFPASRL